MKWYHISLLLCFYGFLKEIRPSEPFVSDYMQLPYRNVTSEQLNRYVYPVATYASLVLSIAVLLVTDLFRYKPIIVTSGIAGTVTFSLLLWTKSYRAAQLIQVTYSLYSACEVGYFAYIYAKVSKEHFLAVSSHTRAALLIGRFISGVSSQTLVHFELLDVHTLNFVSLGTQATATIVALFLPKVKESIYFYRNNASRNEIIEDSHNNLHNGAADNKRNDKFKQAFALMWKQLICAYSNRRVVLWSIWYACGMCAFVQYLSYVQLIWIAIDNRPESVWNGAFEAIATLLSATIALLASRLHTSLINSKLRVLFALFSMSLCASGSIFVTANASTRIVSYYGYMGFYIFYYFTITIASAEIAKELPEDSYGLIFGINTFFAYCLQSILTAIVVTDSFSLELNIFQQMNVYGGFLATIGLLYFILMLITAIRRFKGTKGAKMDINSNNDVNHISP